MRQIFENLENGDIDLVEVPVPNAKKKHLLIKSNKTLISAGTERMLINFGKSNYIQKAQQQPEKVNDVIEKIRGEGLISTFTAVKSRIKQPLPIGYSNVGIVCDVGEGIEGFAIGDRVVSNGPHAEIVNVPVNLCAKIPDEVEDEEAVFTVLGAVALQGIRLAKPTFGETFLVNGLGLVGLLTVQILKAQGCNVLGLDISKEKCKLANELGIETNILDNQSNPHSWLIEKTKGRGIDGALITATTTSSDPINISAKASRKRGRIILVGVTGIDLKRDQLYKKEISFTVSCSYGPGRYDRHYEEKGNDYPIGYVRWTEKRNFEAILEAINKKQINTKILKSNCFDFTNYIEAYEYLRKEKNVIGILLDYKDKIDIKKDKIKLKKILNDKYKENNKIVASVIGAGSYADRILLPALKKTNIKLKDIASINGTSASIIGNKYNFQNATTNIENIFNDNECNTLLILTRHDSHFSLVKEGLLSGKNIFVEKPLCLNIEELNEIENIYIKLQKDNNKTPRLMVGFNRRFAPLITHLNKHIKKINGPKTFIYTINAGKVDKDNWQIDEKIGGGRLIGEVCHFLDLLMFLSDSKIKEINAISIKNNESNRSYNLQISFYNNSIASINYIADGNKTYPKERIEVYGDNIIFEMNNFRKVKAWGKSGVTRSNLMGDKGHKICIKQFIDSIKKGKNTPIKFDEIINLHKHLIDANKNIKKYDNIN